MKMTKVLLIHVLLTFVTMDLTFIILRAYIFTFQRTSWASSQKLRNYPRAL